MIVAIVGQYYYCSEKEELNKSFSHCMTFSKDIWIIIVTLKSMFSLVFKSNIFVYFENVFPLSYVTINIFMKKEIEINV